MIVPVPSPQPKAAIRNTRAEFYSRRLGVEFYQSFLRRLRALKSGEHPSASVRFWRARFTERMELGHAAATVFGRKCMHTFACF